MTQFDCIVVGTGGLGSAAVYHLARRGARVLGIDQFAPPHDLGSSHGQTRIYRQAYYEAPEYVPLALRALELWNELERESGTRLFANTGALTIGPERGELFAGALLSARRHNIAHEVLTSSECERRFPAFRAPSNTIALFEPTGGVLFPEACVSAHLAWAQHRGAVIHTNEAVLGIDENDAYVAVRASTASYTAARVIVAAGAWAPKLIGRANAFAVTRETVHWFAAASSSARGNACPVSMIAHDDGPILYTIPDFGNGFKAGRHHAGRVAEPTQSKAPADADDARVTTELMQRFVPGGAGKLIESAPCYYTTTRDHHFAIGPLPAAPRIILASACSGHGFKFASALGESVAKLALQQDAGLPASLFDVGRL
ncbi:MAG TPA: N-methyl-L-tryptophan oxidase [Gemmatimonadaceae bacterium]|nr:N-methyl-L-tryptophan oxidase [Gemmatimonadaceae bacterium]